MTELLTSALEALKDGLISPFAFTALLVLGAGVWMATKFGDKLFTSVGGLIDVGEKVRQSLAAQVASSDARAAAFQQAADLATARQTLTATDLTTMTLRNEALQAQVARLTADLLEWEHRWHDRHNRRRPAPIDQADTDDASDDRDGSGDAGSRRAG